MTLQTPSQPLIKAIDLASHAVAGQRTQLPACTCVHVWASGSGDVNVTCDSLDARVRTSFNTRDEIKDGFEFLCSPRLLKSSLRADEAKITFKDDRLVIDSGGVTKLLCVPTKEFPKPWPDIEVKPVNGKNLLSAIKLTTRVSDSKNGKEMIVFSSDTNHMIGASTMAICLHPVDLGMDSFMLASSQARIIPQVLDWEEEILVGRDESSLHLQQGNVRVWLRLSEGKFPNHKPFLADSPVQAKINREEFVSALEHLADYVEEEFGRVTITPDMDETWSLWANSINGESEIQIEVEGQTETIQKFICSRSALLDLVKPWTSETINFFRRDNYVVLEPGDESGIRAVSNLIRA